MVCPNDTRWAKENQSPLQENPEAKEDAVQTIPDVFLDGGAGRKGWALGALRQAVLRVVAR